MINTPTQQAQQRVINSLDRLVELFDLKKTKPRFKVHGMLDDLAVAVLAANELHSALGFLYDEMYNFERVYELIDRKIKNPVYKPADGTVPAGGKKE